MVYFVVYLFLEVLISVNISSAIGGLATFFEIMLSAFFGISILINFRKSLVENMATVSYGAIDLEQFQRLNLFTILGGILLIVPGFLTDILGILLQFSAVTTMAINRFNIKSGRYKNNHEQNNNIKKDSNVIDVEIINDNTITK
ncbi:MAG: FxsA family protein [Sulfurimonas sp.]|nr:FxsA family protein [Sulfurimonas sp.]